MSKKHLARTKPHLNIGTMGHVDHGKTTLTAAIPRTLAEVDPTTTSFVAFDGIDRAPEEQVCGTVVTGAIEQGMITAGEQVEVVGLGPGMTSVCIGLGTFGKTLDRAGHGVRPSG